VRTERPKEPLRRKRALRGRPIDGPARRELLQDGWHHERAPPLPPTRRTARPGRRPRPRPIAVPPRARPPRRDPRPPKTRCSSRTAKPQGPRALLDRARCVLGRRPRARATRESLDRSRFESRRFGRTRRLRGVLRRRQTDQELDSHRFVVDRSSNRRAPTTRLSRPRRAGRRSRRQRSPEIGLGRDIAELDRGLLTSQMRPPWQCVRSSRPKGSGHRDRPWPRGNPRRRELSPLRSADAREPPGRRAVTPAGLAHCPRSTPLRRLSRPWRASRQNDASGPGLHVARRVVHERPRLGGRREAPLRAAHHAAKGRLASSLARRHRPGSRPPRRRPRRDRIRCDAARHALELGERGRGIGAARYASPVQRTTSSRGPVARVREANAVARRVTAARAGSPSETGVSIALRMASSVDIASAGDATSARTLQPSQPPIAVASIPLPPGAAALAPRARRPRAPHDPGRLPEWRRRSPERREHRPRARRPRATVGLRPPARRDPEPSLACDVGARSRPNAACGHCAQTASAAQERILRGRATGGSLTRRGWDASPGRPWRGRAPPRLASGCGPDIAARAGRVARR
jgi:hypothetical protein